MWIKLPIELSNLVDAAVKVKKDSVVLVLYKPSRPNNS